MVNPYNQDLDANSANYQPLTPLSFLERAADVCLKERKRLIIVPREMPISIVHLKNMTSITEAGGIILPASPGFYHKPKSISDLVDTVAGRILSLLGFENKLLKPWLGVNKGE